MLLMETGLVVNVYDRPDWELNQGLFILDVIHILTATTLISRPIIRIF